MKQLLYLALLPILFACPSKKGDDPAPSVDSTNVKTDVKWYFQKNGNNDTALVENGKLYLSSGYKAVGKGATLVSATQLSGDFEIRVKFSDFRPSGSGAASSSFSVTLGQNGTSVGGLLTNRLVYTDVTKTVSTKNRQGQYYAKREGDKFVTWMCAGTDTSYFEKTGFTKDNLSVFLNVSSFDNTVDRVSVTVESVKVIGGSAGFQSDTFEQKYIQ